MAKKINYPYNVVSLMIEERFGNTEEFFDIKKEFRIPKNFSILKKNFDGTD